MAEPNGNTSSAVLRVLYAEDDRQDAELCLESLKKAGFEPIAEVVGTPEEFLEKLRSQPFDVVLADHNMLSWSGMEALEIVQREAPEIPFILVTGTIGDEAAVECIKRGVTDYVLKDRPARLPAMIRRALEERKVRQERKSIQEGIRAAKEDWELTFDAVPDAIVIIGEDSRITRVNRSAAELFGRKPEDILGRHCYEVIHGMSEPRADCPHQELNRTGKGTRGDISEPRLNKLFDSTTTPLRDPEGNIRGCVHVLRDVTERERAEKALSASEIRYRRLFEAAQDGVLILEAESGQIIDVNPFLRELLGYSQEELLGKRVWEIGPFQDLFRSESAFKELQESGYIRYEDLPLETKDGRHLDVEYVSKVYLVDGKKVIQCNIRDITERKRMEWQLRQAQKMEAVGQLTGGIAHDFNNLLTIINGYSQVLADHGELSDDTRSKVMQIKEAGERAAALTRQLLAFSRRQVMQPQVLDLNVIIANMDKMLERVIRDDVELVILLSPHPGRVKADPAQIEQILMNLAVNARDAMPKGGKLTIECSEVVLDNRYVREHVSVVPGLYVMLTVSDTGMGIDAETQKHIFEPFFTTKEKGKGTGLGLATVYGIVKQSGGYIWVYSEPGHGTTFKIYLPKVGEIAADAEPPAKGEGPSRGAETILVVDDQRDVLKLVETVLKSHGYTVLAAGRGKEAMRISENHQGPIHLLLTDVVMPEMSGKDLAENMARMRPDTRVLYISGYTDDVISRHGILERGVAFLEKPFTPDSLVRKVREVLDDSSVRGHLTVLAR